MALISFDCNDESVPFARKLVVTTSGAAVSAPVLGATAAFESPRPCAAPAPNPDPAPTRVGPTILVRFDPDMACEVNFLTSTAPRKELESDLVNPYAIALMSRPEPVVLVPAAAAAALLSFILIVVAEFIAIKGMPVPLGATTADLLRPNPLAVPPPRPVPRAAEAAPAPVKKLDVSKDPNTYPNPRFAAIALTPDGFSAVVCFTPLLILRPVVAPRPTPSPRYPAGVAKESAVTSRSFPPSVSKIPVRPPPPEAAFAPPAPAAPPAPPAAPPVNIEANPSKSPRDFKLFPLWA
ncbi:hypothetical protein BOTCAL_0086g00370 [Botryotinia calthae]|uniref:Uncharacterized protein n=1 Tax=Botryotinia calthae TaxID=38488 RepID=A0A4Y8D7Z0_9HELO|nr:hypothetical protein BOTCAL_0086g00370 [Botryotinia calthae]